MVRMAGRGRARDTSATTLPAPVGGLNDRDSVADMKSTYAVIMKNWWPEPSQVSVRKGSLSYATGMTGQVESLFEYSPPSGNPKMFAAVGGEIFDVTSSGAVGTAVVTGKSNNKWQVVPFTTAGGSFIYCFNGEDKPLLYDGSTWVEVDGSSTPAITGIADTKTIIDGVAFKGRGYLVEKASLNLWYLPPASIGGAAAAIDMGQLFQRGGHIVTARTWTIDAGEGSDDHLVVISSNGEVVVFAGSDPAVATSWAVVGVFYIGRPIGQRCTVKFGGDLLIICEDGVFPLGKGLLSASIDSRVALTDVIQNSIRQAANTYKNTFGWELCLAPDYAAVILNVPTQTGKKQYVMNTLTGAWAEFEGWGANCWLYSESGLYYGGDGKVIKAWVQDSDDGTPIFADVLQAFSHFGSNVQTKFFTMIRPYISTGGTPSIRYSLNGDYTPSTPDGVLVAVPPSGMVWGSMTWGGMVWGGSLQHVQDWLTVGGIYKSAGLRLQVSNGKSAVEWAATDVLYSRGGLL